MKYIKLPHYPSGYDIEFGDEDNAGMDLRAAHDHDVTLKPNEEFNFPSGLKIHIGSEDIKDGFKLFGMVVPRSGLGFKYYTRLANTAGIIDPNYQGEIMIKLRNESVDKEITIQPGDRVCQLIFIPYHAVGNFELVEEFETTSRGTSGFGSSGVK